MNSKSLGFSVFAAALLLGASANAQETRDAVAPPPPPVRPASSWCERNCTVAKFEGGVAYASLLGLSFVDAHVGVAVGQRIRNSFALLADGTLDIGQSPYGVRMRRGSLGVTIEGYASRFFFGGGLHLAYFGIQRVTHGQAITTLAAGLHGLVGVDLLNFGERDSGALYIGARGEADLTTNGSRLLSGHAMAGLRF